MLRGPLGMDDDGRTECATQLSRQNCLTGASPYVWRSPDCRQFNRLIKGFRP